MKDQDRPAIGTMTVGRCYSVSWGSLRSLGQWGSPLNAARQDQRRSALRSASSKEGPNLCGLRFVRLDWRNPLSDKNSAVLALERVLCDPGTIKDHTCKSEPLTTAGALNR
jgi:hypothetical protein